MINTPGYAPIRVTLDYTMEQPALLHGSQRISTVAIPSNMGRGTVFYFVCPVMGVRCRILYYVPGAGLLVSRTAIRPGLVYPSQSYGQVDMYHYLNERLEREYARRATHTYRGKVTRRAARVARLQERVEDYEALTTEMMARDLLAVMHGKL